MATFKAPGVKILENDVSEIVAPTGTSVGAMVGKTNQGIANSRVLVTSDKNFVDVFGAPETASDIVHQAALAFTQESDSLWFVRSTFGDESYSNMSIRQDTILTSATSGTPATSASTITAASTSTTLAAAGFEDGNTPTSQNGEAGIYDLESANPLADSDPALDFTESLLVGSIGPGVYGNDIGISIVTCAATELENTENGFTWKFQFDDSVSGAPANPTLPSTVWSKVYRVNVYTKPTTQDDTYWSAGVESVQPAESFLVSNYPNLKDGNGTSLYLPDVINGSSSLVYVKPVDSTYPAKSTTITSLKNGADGSTNTAANKQSAWTLFNDKEKVDVNILCVPDEPASQADIQTFINVGGIAANRQDCIAVGQVGSKTETTSQAIITKFNNNYGFLNPSYVAVYAGYSQIFDSFTDKKIFVPNAVYGAQIMARTDNVANTWDAPAGVNRGILPVLGQLKKYNEAEIGNLYDNNINSVKFISGTGSVLWGQKTAQRKKTSLDRINVRRLLLFIEGSIEPTLLPFLFERNTDKTRSRVFSVIDGFMSTVLAGEGVTNYQVVVNETNNGPEVVDNNQLNIDLYVQPTRSIEFIALQVTITRTGANFNELV